MSGAAKRHLHSQRELLMERVRARSTTQKSYPDLAKSMRMYLMERRFTVDAVEKTTLQFCLDALHPSIKVTSRQGLVERLRSISRQLGLKFMDDSRVLFISTDMFFIEIILDQEGTLQDVKVHHESRVEQQSCTELLECLKRGDFSDFMAQLEGFSSIYQLNAEPKVKTKAFDAIQSMEADLCKIFDEQNSANKDLFTVLNHQTEAVVIKRRGGHAMRLIYYLSPYDLINVKKGTIESPTMKILEKNKIGYSFTVHLEASSANKLQIAPTVTFAKDSQSGLEVPVFAPLTPNNSMLLPATFVIKLNKPLPVSYNSWRTLNFCGGVISGPTMSCSNATASSSGSKKSNDRNTLLSNNQNKGVAVNGNIISLTLQIASEQQIQNNKNGLYVRLLDQTHCYYFTEKSSLQVIRINS